MKKIILILLLNFSLHAQVGINTTTPAAELEINSSTRGLLIPRVSLTSLTIEAPVTNPQGGGLVESTLVYHDGSNGIPSGFYYWNITKWESIAKNNNRGLQFYAFTGSGSSPNINKTNFNFNIVNSGIWTGLLNDASRSAIQTGDNYMILFTGTLVVENAGNFRIRSTSDDGARVYIDGIPVLNRWIDQGTTAFDGTEVFLARGNHKIEFWYYENTGSEFMQFEWLSNANGSSGVIDARSFIID